MDDLIPYRLLVAVLVLAALAGALAGWLTGPYGLFPLHP